MRKKILEKGNSEFVRVLSPKKKKRKEKKKKKQFNAPSGRVLA
jgi:hypothetical protein